MNTVYARRDVMRRLGIAGLSFAGLAGFGTLWTREILSERAEPQEGRPGFATIRHQLGWSKGVQFAGQYLAQTRGYFDRERLDVECVAGGPNTSFRSLVASGQALVSESVPTGLIEGFMHGQPLTAFAAVLQRDPASLLSPSARPVNSLRDLVGRTVGAPDNVRMQIVALLRGGGIDPAGVKFVPSGMDTSMLMSGDVDVMYAWATTSLPSLTLAGFDTHVLNLSDIGAPSYGGVLFTRRDHIEKQFDTFVRYTRALMHGWADMVAQPEQTAREIVQKWAPPGTSLADQLLQAKTMVPYLQGTKSPRQNLLWIEPEIFESNLRLMSDAGALPRGVKLDLGKLVTQDVVRAATGSS